MKTYSHRLRWSPRARRARSMMTLLALTTFGACTVFAEPAAPTSPPRATAPASARPTIAIGMSADTVRALIGAPQKIKRLKQKHATAEVWFYRFSKPAGCRQVATGTREVPYVDPISGTAKMILEPVYGLEQTSVEETTELLMVDGALAAAKRYRSSRRNYD